jgi:hypothetical protein
MTAYHNKLYSNIIPIPSMISTLILAFLASLLTVIQILLILFRNEGICLNEGCTIVDSLATVPPIIFNIVGLLFFQGIFWGGWLARKRSPWLMAAVKVMLLAGMASEGVLTAFQYSVAEIFCSYCLIIFAFVVFLNLSIGFRQLASGLLIFFAVFLAFSSLKFQPGNQSGHISLKKGTYGARLVAGKGLEFYLFFSSSCPHCETIIETLRCRTGYSISFQPVKEIEGFDFPGLQLAPDYSAAVNRNFLMSIGIEEIPVLLVKEGADDVKILQGERKIREYLDQKCPEDRPAASIDFLGTSTNSEDFSMKQEGEDSCSAIKDCSSPSSSPGTN